MTMVLACSVSHQLYKMIGNDKVKLEERKRENGRETETETGREGGERERQEGREGERERETHKSSELLFPHFVYS